MTDPFDIVDEPCPDQEASPEPDQPPEESTEDAAYLHQQQRAADGEACLESALFYLSLGWSVLALCPPDHAGVGKEHAKNCKGGNAGKRPMGPWKEYQDRLPTENEIRAKWDRVPGANVGIALGPVSGLIRVDVEGELGEKALQEKSRGDLPPTLEFKSGRADGTGRGLLFRIPPGTNLRTTSEDHGAKQELRFQARGAQTVLPPSRHYDGNLYTWKKGHSPGQMDAAMAPAWLVAELSTARDGGTRKGAVRDLDEIINGSQEGHRNENAASFIGRLLLAVGDLSNAASVKLQWTLASLWNERNDPPLPDDELRSVFNSILRAERERRDRLDQDKLSNFIQEQVEASVHAISEKSEALIKESHPDHQPNASHPVGLNGHSHHDQKPAVEKSTDPGRIPSHLIATVQPDDLPDWHLIIIDSDPREFRLRSPQWSASSYLRKGYITLDETQIRNWSNSTNGIPQAAYSQGLCTIDPVFKGWAKPGGPLAKLTDSATIVAVAPENKRAFYILGCFYRYLMTARSVLQDDGQKSPLPSSGRPMTLENLSIVFKLENLKKFIQHNKEEFKIREMTKIIEDYGATQGVLQSSRWWIVERPVIDRIGSITLEAGSL